MSGDPSALGELYSRESDLLADIGIPAMFAATLPRQDGADSFTIALERAGLPAESIADAERRQARQRALMKAMRAPRLEGMR